MTKAEKVAKLKAAGLDEEAIEAIVGGDSDSELATLKAKIAEAEGKANGILGDKKKYQAKVDELQAKLDELEGKDLGEAGKLKLEMERMRSRLEASEKAKADLESTYKSDKRNAELNKITGRLKFLDTVPEDARQLLISTELKDLEDLGNTVLVDERLKSVSTKYAGLLAANVPGGAGTKAGQQTNQTGNRSFDLASVSLKEVSKDPASFLKTAMAAIEK